MISFGLFNVCLGVWPRIMIWSVKSLTEAFSQNVSVFQMIELCNFLRNITPPINFPREVTGIETTSKIISDLDINNN